MDAIRINQLLNPSKNTDPALLEAANGLLAAGLDLLGTPLTPEGLDSTMRELLDVFGFDAAAFLSAVFARYKQGRIEQPGADVLAEVAAARLAFDNITVWGATVQAEWSAQLLGVAADKESVAAARLDRAIKSSPGALDKLLRGVVSAGDPDTLMATIRLAEESTTDWSLDAGIRGMLNQFTESARPPIIKAGMNLVAYVQNYRDKTVGFAGFMTRQPGPQAA